MCCDGMGWSGRGEERRGEERRGEKKIRYDIILYYMI